jgi:hypothetical protein
VNTQAAGVGRVSSVAAGIGQMTIARKQRATRTAGALQQERQRGQSAGGDWATGGVEEQLGRPSERRG